MVSDLQTHSIHLNQRLSPRRSINLDDDQSYPQNRFQAKKNSHESNTSNAMNRTSPNKFPKLDLSPERLTVTKIPHINMNFEST